MGYAQRAVAQADSGGRQGDAHGSARPSAGQSAKKKGSILRRDGCAGCCPSAVALGGRRASGRRRSSARRSGCGDERKTPLLLSFLLSAPPVPVTILVPRPAAKANPPMRSPTRAMAVLTGADGRAAARPTPDRTGAVTGSRQAGERAIRQPPPGDRQQHARCRLRAKSIPCLQGAKLRRLLGAARPTQRSPVVVVGTPSLSAGRVAGCRKGRQVEPSGLAAVRGEQRSTDQSASTSPVRRHQLMLKQRQHCSQRVGRRHQLMLKRRRHDHGSTEDEDGPRGGRRLRPSSAQRRPGRRPAAAPPGEKGGAAADGRRRG